MQEASRRHRQGELAEAEQLYCRVLADKPNHPPAMAQLGLLKAQQGDAAAAVQWIARAVALDDSVAEWHNNLGVCQRTIGSVNDAILSFQRALEIRSDYADAHVNLGMAFAQQGNLDAAIKSFRGAIQLSPQSAPFLSNLANALRNAGQIDDAIECYSRALAIDPSCAGTASNLGNMLRDKGQLDDAIAAYEKAIAAEPRCHVVRSNLAVTLLDKGEVSQAIAQLNICLQINPAFAEGHNNLGVCLRKTGALKQAMAAFQKAMQLSPTYCEACSNFASALIEQGKMREGLAAHEQAMRLNPRSADAINNYAVALQTVGQFSQAVAMLRRAISIKPQFARAHSNLGAVLRELGQLDEATTACQKAIEIDPRAVEAHNNLANCWRDRGRLDKALASFSTALKLAPQAHDVDSNRVFTMHFHPDFDERDLATASRQWAQRHAAAFTPSLKPHRNDLTADRRLRIGYVSPDFRRHAAACFMLPLLANHDPKQVEIFCYAGVKRPDDVTDRLRKLAHGWCSTIGLNDDAVADMIRSDQIDILIDLSLHMADNRLLVFARRPAPVQVTWLGYPGTTGLSTIDYRLSDPHLDPDAGNDHVYAEQTVRLPHSFWCYAPIANTPDVNELPAIAAGRFTFGSFNNFCKVTPPTLQLWAQTLRAIPSARMLIQCQPGSHRQDVLRQMSDQGLAADRIEFVGLMRDEEYFKLYQRVDACLDPIPYPGHTTSLDSLWMGVPVVTLAGRTAVSRGGASILRNVNLGDLVANSADEYVQIASRLAADPSRMQSLRCNLRQMLQSSPLMNAKKFAGDMENIFRQMWQNYCLATTAKAA